MAYGFFAVYAVGRFRLPDSVAAVFTGILLGSGVIGYAVWGPIGDCLNKEVISSNMASACWVKM